MYDTETRKPCAHGETDLLNLSPTRYTNCPSHRSDDPMIRMNVPGIRKVLHRKRPAMRWLKDEKAPKRTKRLTRVNAGNATGRESYAFGTPIVV